MAHDDQDGGHVHDWDAGRWGVIVGVSRCRGCGVVARMEHFTPPPAGA